MLVLYRGSPAWFLFSFPKTAVRFYSFEQAHHLFKRNTGLSSNGLYVSSGIVAGLVEAVLCLTPMQNLSLKLTHEAASERKPILAFIFLGSLADHEREWCSWYAQRSGTVVY